MMNRRKVSEKGRIVAVVLALASGGEVWGAAPCARFISHRGESLEAPENTMAAFRAAAEGGADGLECDVYLTKDNEIICLHDRTAKRTGGLDVKPGDVTLAELQALDAGQWKGPQFKGERMPTLAEVLTLARDNFEIYVEIKCGAEILPRLAEVMAAEPRVTPERVLFICFASNIVSAVREMFPDYRAYWLTGTGPKKDGQPGPTTEQVIAMAKGCRASGVSMQDSVDITPEYVRAVKAAGFSAHIWTVNNASRARTLVDMGVDTITTDCGVALKQVLCDRLVDREPIIHWTFDGTAKNAGAGGARYDATLAGEPEYVAGMHGQGLRLDGMDDVAGAAYQLSLRGTVALWFLPESFYNFNTILDNDIHADRWEMWTCADGRLRFRVLGDNGSVACDLKAFGGAGRWYHLAVVWDVVDKREVRLYVDGVERSTGALTRWSSPGGTFYVGGGNPGNTRGRGVVDDVRVYRVPLTESHVREVCQPRMER